jgi:hypothetical protein
MPIHWLATYLDPSFRELGFVKDRHLRCKQQKVIQEGLQTMLDDINIEAVANNDDVSTPMTDLTDLVFICRSMCVFHHRKEEKTMIKIMIRLQIYATTY